MKSFRLLSLVMCMSAVLALGSCKEPIEDPYILINGEKTLSISQDKATLQVYVASNREWAVRMNKETEEWMQIEPAGGMPSEHAVQVTLTVAENMGANRTAAIEFYTGTATDMLTVIQQGPDGESDGVKAISVAEFIGKADTGTYYRLTGVVSGFNASYCSFDLTDATGTIYVYSVTEASKAEWKDKIKNGGTVTLKGVYKYYGTKHEVVEAVIEEFIPEAEAPVTTATAAQIIAAGVEGNYQIAEATIVNVPSVNTLIVNDGTGYMYAYKSKHGFAEGDVVTVKGKVVLYEGKVLEFDNPDITKTGAAIVTHPEPAAWGADEIDGYFSAPVITVKYVSVLGLVIKDDKYTNLRPFGTKACEVVSLYVGDADLTAYENCPVRVTGYAFTATAETKNISVAVVDIVEISGAQYVLTDPASLLWGADDVAPKTVAVLTSGTDVTVEAVAEAFGGDVWATATVSGKTITITPSGVNTSQTQDRTGAFKVTSDGMSIVLNVTQSRVLGAHPFTSNVTWKLGSSAYDHTTGNDTSPGQSAVINGTEVNELVKLGTSSKNGDFTATIPAGTKKIAFYSLGWKGSSPKLNVTCGSGQKQTFSIKANDGVVSNPPYTITTSDADAYYEVQVDDASATSVKFESEGRVIVWGINAYNE
ncbi:MAG: BACON domain-containing protein [Bacteroidales bacterium]|nr:BACON domain-containing protein [Bacteroidales bacterium]